MSLIFEGKYLNDYEAPKLFDTIAHIESLRTLILKADVDKLAPKNIERFYDLMESSV